MKIVLNLDGVIADCESAALDRFGPCDQREYDFFKRWPNRDNLMHAWLTSASEYRKFLSVPGAEMGTSILAHQWNFDIHIVSSRPATFAMWAATRDWLTDRKIPYHTLRLVDRGNKADTIARLRPLVAVDDDPWQIAELQARAVPTIVMDYPWNKQTRSLRAGSWHEVLEHVQALYGLRTPANQALSAGQIGAE